MLFTSEYMSPIGCIKIITDEESVVSVSFAENNKLSSSLPAVVENTLSQLDEYFCGKRKSFDLPLNINTTPFRRKVFGSLLNIQYGETASYKQIAEKINNPRAVRAIGGANNKNPIAIIIPCHRVIGADGSLVGYSGGIERKIWLLRHEQKNK